MSTAKLMKVEGNLICCELNSKKTLAAFVKKVPGYSFCWLFVLLVLWICRCISCIVGIGVETTFAECIEHGGRTWLFDRQGLFS
jgi:hypothetical protein